MMDKNLDADQKITLYFVTLGTVVALLLFGMFLQAREGVAEDRHREMQLMAQEMGEERFYEYMNDERLILATP